MTPSMTTKACLAEEYHEPKRSPPEAIGQPSARDEAVPPPRRGSFVSRSPVAILESFLTPNGRRASAFALCYRGSSNSISTNSTVSGPEHAMSWMVPAVRK
jgi:hypothetical protein